MTLALLVATVIVCLAASIIHTSFQIRSIDRRLERIKAQLVEIHHTNHRRNGIVYGWKLRLFLYKREMERWR